MRILFFGSNGTLSVVLLRHLLDAGLPIQAVVLPITSPRLTLESEPLMIYRPDDVTSVCQSAGVPILTVDRRLNSGSLAGHQPDLIICACFPQILPACVLALPAHGCLNLHPSLLPAYRGPAPLFWQFRAGEQTSGLSLHYMSAVVDGGDIIAQSSTPLALGISAGELNRELGAKGAETVITAVEQIARGESERQSQDEAFASYFPWPQPSDFALDPNWSAKHAFGFMRGTRELGQPYPIVIGSQHFALEAALLYSENDVIGKPFERFGSDIRIQLNPGVLHATLVPSSAAGL